MNNTPVARVLRERESKRKWENHRLLAMRNKGIWLLVRGSTGDYKISLISHEAFKHQSFIVQHVRLYNRVASTLSPLHTVTMMLKASHINTQVDTDDDINTSLPVFSDSPRLIIL